MQRVKKASQCCQLQNILKSYCSITDGWWQALCEVTTSRKFSASSIGFCPCPPDVVWTCCQLPGWRLLPHHRCSPKKTALGWHSYASRQSDAHQLQRQSLQCSWTSSLELSVDRPQTAGLVVQPFQIVTEDGQWKQSAKVNPPFD